MIWAHNHHSPLFGINAVLLIRAPVSRVVALVIGKRLEQICGAMLALTLLLDRLNNSPFIFHFPVTGVKNSGIFSCSIFFLSDARTNTLSRMLSGSAPAGVKLSTIP